MKWMKSIVKKIDVYDVAMIKLSVFFVTLFLITAWPGFNKVVMSISWYWFLVIGVLFGLTVLKKTMGKAKRQNKSKKKK